MRSAFRLSCIIAPMLSAALLASCSPNGAGMGTQPPSSCAPRPIDADSEAGFAQAVICLGEGEGARALTVELARTSAEQQRGLMYRTALAPDRGMLFPFAYPRPASFWMKNTFIPLDMVFIRSDGSIESILADVPPQTLEPRRSGEAVAAVLELGAGRARALGLAPGDKVYWPR